MHTVIIGNGILALSTAFQLARRAPADTVTIVGPAHRPGSASLAAAAMLNSFAELEKGTLESPAAMSRFELSHLATRLWPRFILDVISAAGSRLPAGCAACTGPCGGCFGNGTFVLDDPQDDDGPFDAIVAALEQFDEPHEHVAISAVPNYRPSPRFASRRAVHLPREGWINPRLTIGALEAALGQPHGVRTIDAHVTRIEHASGTITGVTLSDGRRLEADRYLLATGATATDLLTASGLDLPIQRVFYGVGITIELASPRAPHTKCVRTPSRGLYSVPFFEAPDRPLDHVLVGATNLVLPAPAPVPSETIAQLRRDAIDQINTAFESAEVARVNVGWRPISQDTLPLVGPTSVPNLIVATGTRRDGFHMAPLLSEMLADLLHGAPVDPRLTTFAPERSPLMLLSRERAISQAVKRGYQRDDIERLHDRAGADAWGIPPEMLEMYRHGHARPSGTSSSGETRLPSASRNSTREA